MEHKTFAFETKEVGADGTFSGYLAVFGNVDSYGDVIRPGAFAKSLANFKREKRLVPILWQHYADKPIGVFDSVTEDEKGLFVSGSLLIGEVQQAREAHALVKAGAISGMSIGFNPVKAKDLPDGTRELNELALWEGSIVTFPANTDARITAVKATAADINKAAKLLQRAIKMHVGHMDGSIPTDEESQKKMMDLMVAAYAALTGDDPPAMKPMKSLPEFEKFLREAGGYSKTQATAIANGGLSKLLRSESDNAYSARQAISDALAVLRS